MRDYDEKDYEAISKLQEIRTCTRDHARKQYKKAVLKLADPDHANRAAIVIENFHLGTKPAEVEEVQVVNEDAKEEPVPVKEKKAKKSEPKSEYEAPVSQHAVPLVPVEKHVHTANLFGKKHAVLYVSIERETNNLAKDRFKPPHISEARLELVRNYAKSNSMPVAVCVGLLFNGEVDQGYAIPEKILRQYAGQLTRGRLAMSLSNESRKAYQDEGWDGCVFEEIVKKAVEAA